MSTFNAKNEPIIYKYVLDYFNPEEQTTFDYSLEWDGVSAVVTDQEYEETEKQYTQTDMSTEDLLKIIEGANSQSDWLLLVLLWNADEDLDMAFEC